MPTSTKQNTPQNAHRSPLEPQKINLGTKLPPTPENTLRTHFRAF